MKKPMDDLTKAKLIYSGELLIFSVVFIVLSILTMCGVIGVNDRRILILTILTLAGGAYFIYNTIMYFVSEKKRKRSSLLDTLLLVPVPLVMIPLDILRFCGKIPNEAYPWIIGITFIYISIVYIIEAIYHWYIPLPLLLEAAEEAEKEAKEEEAKILEEPQTEDNEKRPE